jgi:hypothetical protein
VPEPVDQPVYAPDGEASNGIDLVLDRGRVARDLADEAGDLSADRPADPDDDTERQNYRKQDRGRSPQPRPPQQSNDRGEQERQQHRDRDRNQDFAREIQSGHDNHRNQQQRVLGRRRRRCYLSPWEGRRWWNRVGHRYDPRFGENLQS